MIGISNWFISGIQFPHDHSQGPGKRRRSAESFSSSTSSGASSTSGTSGTSGTSLTEPTLSSKKPCRRLSEPATTSEDDCKFDKSLVNEDKVSGKTMEECVSVSKSDEDASSQKHSELSSLNLSLVSGYSSSDSG